ncbi:hypothetical protein [Gluconacetobacter diazotrophicus]|uniref:hypothetical protein n=1 Tax=Gluconacetobacter diazotrophicus TaxID=33996 RepID=UPI0012FEDC0C|nr:hypothetical protein [Gluconacetobacter diazotrophicus]
MSFVLSLRPFAVPSFIMLVLAACASRSQPKTNDTQMFPIQSAAKQCADQILAIGHTEVGETTLFGIPYILKDHMEQAGALSARTWQTITLPAVSIPADGLSKGATWKGCMKNRGYQF